MPRELVLHLMARKKALHAEQFEIENKLSALPPEHLWVVDIDTAHDPLDLTPEEMKVKETSIALNSRKLQVQAQLDRAERFRTQHPGGVLPPFCPDCFIDQNVDSLMVEVKSDRGNGIRQFECPSLSCKLVLHVNPL